jgi:hypothetical protein
MANNKHEVSAKKITTAGFVMGGFFTLAKEAHSHVHQAINSTSHPQEVPNIIANICSNLMTVETGYKVISNGAIGAAIAFAAYAWSTEEDENAELTPPFTSSTFSSSSSK